MIRRPRCEFDSRRGIDFGDGRWAWKLVPRVVLASVSFSVPQRFSSARCIERADFVA